MRKNTKNGIWSTTPLKNSQWSHLRLFDNYTKYTLDLYYRQFFSDVWWPRVDKLKKLIQEKLAYTYVHKKTNNYKQKNTYSHKMYNEKITSNMLFNVLYQPLDTEIGDEKTLLKDIQNLMSSEWLVSLQELRDVLDILPPNLQAQELRQLQSLEDMWSTVQWIDKQKNLFSAVRNKKIDLFCLLKK